MNLLIIPVVAGLTCIGAALYLFLRLRAAKISSPKMSEIGSYIAIGVRAYLSRQLQAILLVTPVVAIVLGLTLNIWIAITFVLGVFTSLITAYMGMSASTRANVKTADDATRSVNTAFHTAVFGGSIMGFSITGFSLVVLSVLYLLFKDPNPLVGFGFGASLAALFAQIGGGIYTKAADIGADLVGKIEANIPEDDPRNPAVVADLVGDNVGDCAGRGADLFQTFSDDIVTGMVVALTPSDLVQRRLALYFGIIPMVAEQFESVDHILRTAVAMAHTSHLARRGDKIIITAGSHAGVAGSTNLIKVETLD